MAPSDAVPLREHLECLIEDRFKAVYTLIDSNEKQVAIAFSASEKAIQKAEDSQLRHNATTNEFRAQLGDQAKTFLPRLEAEAIIKGLTEKIAAMQKLIDANTAKSSGFTGGWGAALAIIGLVSLVVAIASRFLP